MSKNQKVKDQQLKLNLKHSLFNGLAKYKERFEMFRAQWDIKKYTKSTWVWFTIVLSLSFLITQIYTIQEKISMLPNQIPIFQIYIDSNKTLAPANYIYIIPATTMIVIILGITFSNKYYNQEKELSNTLLWVMFLANLVITVSLIRLINLY